MLKEDMEDFLKIISKHGFVEDDFEITESVTYPPPGIVGKLFGTRTLKHKKSGITKTYEIYGAPPTWFTELEDDMKAGFYKTRQ
jgi:hypothetical protein